MDELRIGQNRLQRQPDSRIEIALASAGLERDHQRSQIDVAYGTAERLPGKR